MNGDNVTLAFMDLISLPRWERQVQILICNQAITTTSQIQNSQIYV